MVNKILLKSIPSKWTKEDLGRVADVSMGQSPSSLFYNQKGEGLPFFQGKADFTDDFTVNIRQWTSEITRVSNPGDILMSVRAPVGDVVVNNVKACIGRGIASIKAKESICDQGFLFQKLLSLNDELNKKSQGSTFKAINGPALRKINFNLPTLPEQKKIAQILSSIDERIQEVNSVISETEKLRDGLMRDLFTKGIGHIKFKKTKAWLIPEKWTVSKLKDVCRVVSGATPKTVRPEYWNGDIVWVTPKDLSILATKYIHGSKRMISKEGLESCAAAEIPPRSLIMSSRAPIGYLAINTIGATTNQGCKSMIPGGELNVEYLFYYLTKNMKDIKKLGSGSTFAEVGKQVVENIEILLPPREEQGKIVEILSSVDEKINKSIELREKLTYLKRGLMSDLLSGRVRTIKT